MARRQKGWFCNMMLFILLVIWIFVRKLGSSRSFYGGGGDSKYIIYKARHYGETFSPSALVVVMPKPLHESNTGRQER